MTKDPRGNYQKDIEFAVFSREDKKTREGFPYAVLKVGRGPNRFAVNVWSEHLSDIAQVGSGWIVQLLGEFHEKDGRQQYQLKSISPIRKMRPEDLESFLPRIGRDPEELWLKIDGWIGELKGSLKRAVETVFRDDYFVKQFKRAPGATRGHHAMLGGLLLHTVEVASIARTATDTMGGSVPLVTAGALLHDIGKVEAYAIGLEGFENTEAGHLLGHIVLGSLMLQKRLATLPTDLLLPEQRLELHHFIQSHHGILEYGAAVRPMTLEAELLHFADQSSAKGNDFNDALGDPELFPTADLKFSAKRSWRLERRVWKRSHSWE